MKKFTSILCLLFVFVMLLSLPITAARTYQTYTYSIDGKALYSPDAYTAQKTIDAAAMGLDLSVCYSSGNSSTRMSAPTARSLPTRSS